MIDQEEDQAIHESSSDCRYVTPNGRPCSRSTRDHFCHQHWAMVAHLFGVKGFVKDEEVAELRHRLDHSHEERERLEDQLARALSELEGEHVYFVQRQDSAIKIGRSYHLRERMATLTNLFGPLKLLATLEGDHEEEYALHQEFKEDRLEGEWFSPSPRLLAYVSELASRRARNWFGVRRAGGESLVSPGGSLHLVEPVGNRALFDVKDILTTKPLVYRLYDQARQLVYVGMTRNPLMFRLRGHQQHAPWWFEAAYVNVQTFDSAEEALRAEAEAIAFEKPRHNKAGVPRPPTPELTDEEIAVETMRVLGAECDEAELTAEAGVT